MRSKAKLLSILNAPDSRLSTKELMGKRSAEARGLPYYGRLKKLYPIHFSSFQNMHRRLRNANLETDFPRTAHGFILYLRYLGDVPHDMFSPTVGRANHDVGYVRGNFAWESKSDNSSESSTRSKLHTNGTSRVLPNVKKHQCLMDFIRHNKGVFHCTTIMIRTGYKSGRWLLEAVSHLDGTKIVRYVNRDNYCIKI